MDKDSLIRPYLAFVFAGAFFGAGQFFNGEYKKGLILWAIFIGLFIIGFIFQFPLIIIPMIPLYIYSVVDAVLSANDVVASAKYKMEMALKENAERNDPNRAPSPKPITGPLFEPIHTRICPGCQAEISDEAPTCPRCGKKLPAD